MAKRPKKKSQVRKTKFIKSTPVLLDVINFVEEYKVTPIYAKPTQKKLRINSTLGSTKRGDVVHCGVTDKTVVVIDDMSEQVFAQPLESNGNDQEFFWKKNIKRVVSR